MSLNLGQGHYLLTWSAMIQETIKLSFYIVQELLI